MWWYFVSYHNMVLLQSGQLDSLLLAGLTLWLNWLELWLSNLSVVSAQVRIPAGSLHWGLVCRPGTAQHIDNSLRADWFSCFWPGVNGGLPAEGAWCHCVWREECDNPASLLASRKRGMWHPSQPASLSKGRNVTTQPASLSKERNVTTQPTC